jgi:membrane associated rhomboid family serine protease
MAFNMLILLHLGREAVARLGTPGFLLLFAVSSAGGGLAYWLLGDGETPMLGASGVVFGLFGATMWWDIQRRRAAGASLEPVLRLAGGLVLMNGLLWLLVSGMLAWQAHLGGFVGGMALAAIVTPAPGRRPGL